MKTESLVLVALAGALAYSGRGSGSGCGPGGCLLLPPDFTDAAVALSARAATPPREADLSEYPVPADARPDERKRLGATSAF